MKQLAIDWGELTSAFDDSFGDANYYLDTETGRVLFVMDETRRELENIYEAQDKPEKFATFDIEAVLDKAGTSDWEKAQLIDADLVEQHYGFRVIAVPTTTSHDEYEVMENFIDTVQDNRLRGQLQSAIQGRGAFRHFKDVLGRHLVEEQRWIAFQENQMRDRVLEWLTEMEIEPIDVPPPAGVNLEKLVEFRHKLLDEVLIFARAASRQLGVTRIALIGSLTTDKVDPKDADLLVTVRDDMDLTSLATLGRKLQGHCQNFNRGGEVFLADGRHHYLGRICPWKQCAPFIRASCDALNCGKRPFLHDDHQTIKPSHDLIANPPIELWPQVVSRVTVPDDLVERVIRPLRQDN